MVSLLSALTHDFTRVFNIFTGLLMYITPVIYSCTPENKVLSRILYFNPLTYQICSCRSIMINGTFHDFQGYIYSSVFCISLFLFFWHLFYVSEKRVIERIF
jgi:ABC-type polysaccharide/polyol phosphate export permease